jgi:phosphoribosylaminoimidazole-succinocarboxamide synthase
MMDKSLDTTLRGQLERPLARTDFPGLGEKYEGKVRDCYITADGRRIIVVTDRVSAFDVVLGTIPCKGQILNQIAQYWFEQTAHIAPNHMLEVPDPNVMIGRECEPLKAEFVMRAYLTGTTSTSIWRHYERGERRFCGHALPEGMKQHERLPAPILTPSTKADKGDHDMSASRDELLAMGAITAEDFDRAAQMVQALFELGQRRAAERGLILVDTKYELGRAPDGDIRVIDEIHTPDSSRYWYAGDYDDRMSRGESPRSIDKEYVRRWMVDNHGYRGDGPPPPIPDDVKVEAAKRYIEIYEVMTGREFVPDTSDPLRRIAVNLGIAS